MANRSPRQLLEFALIFAAIYFLSQAGLRYFFPEQFGGEPPAKTVTLAPVDPTLRDGHHPVLTVRNNTEKTLSIANRCPLPPVDIFFSETGDNFTVLQPSEDPALPCEQVDPVAPGESQTIDLGPWKYSLFSRNGAYEARLALPPGFQPAGSGSTLSARFTMKEAGPHVKLFRTFITEPFLNFLIFIASIHPTHDLGIAIIILTLIVKLLLYFPTQHALEGQKKMQLLQPKMDDLKKRYSGDPQKLQSETMKLWKEHKVNPFQSCLPMLVQFPVLIGLFYVIRDGSVLNLSRHLIYPMYQHLDWSFDTHFLGLDLLKPNWVIMPAALMIMQFIQMKLSFAISDRKKAKEKSQESIVEVAKEGVKDPVSATKMQQNMMLYGLPFMIGFFAFQFPAAVALYWGVSTLFAIGQQIIVNREHIRP
ncbi:YidC/Oxa1 family membrane protein insertase [Candidatus Peregrinibacteria bacterium]|nr:YidC/Oxa1 family membrane protein insertase [Candidatus Peregrinibacteria bacterium]